MLILRQMFDAPSSTYSYLLADGGEAVLIDPVLDQARRDAALITELGLRLVYTLETHIHADHVTGALALKRRLGSRIALSSRAGAENADRGLDDGERIAFGNRYLDVRATPGHTATCLTYVLDDQTMAFTGDALLIRGCGRTDFQQGDARRLYRSIKAKILTLPETCLIYPGHDYRGATMSTVGEERAFNPRVGGALSEDDFALHMAHLELAHPKQMALAVPANLKCGWIEGADPTDDPDWAPLRLSFAGVWEVEPSWVFDHQGDVQIVDVREPSEWDGALGRIAGAIAMPLSALGAGCTTLSKDRPIITVCRAGGRSAQASAMLQKRGFTRLANLAGGMLRWRSYDLPTLGGLDFDAGL